ncbi:uncharacterized protein [Blastocystis hominis]|uniref:60S ribosomal protein L13 n=1 Tax=Blastocystis hominis TaxID=12968 RepID=D8LVW5_BLAHO|nr:uncharacterized protein [Blastocystis hominis]XP_012894041.1 uncharacterized protein [Blastocystis hominis]XP_012894733.1 uncharacterized protein [Blastocystis hominis]CBK19954.2 unnamed protein product [Blastocystis hominis]CBK19993.2 unnamed protein product [Blastocystis hominis]CBK20685.2 unnamed protein product [Blastocystis hominis]|eukprot:XP_012894002.1 uncharacterized protein [Blastocystis hominis]
MKTRLGRGFTLQELKEAGINPREALTIGIAVDHRRVNRCVESLQANVERLNAYKSKLILFPRGEMAAATQLNGTILPIEKVAPKVEFMEVTPELKKRSAFMGLRQALCDAHNFGKRAKRAAKAAEKEN